MATGKQISELEDRIRKLECCCIKEIQIISGAPTDAPSNPNQVFALDQDTGTLYFWNGSSWGIVSDSDWLALDDGLTPTNTEAMYHEGQVILGDNQLVKTGTGVLQISDEFGTYRSGIDILGNNAVSHAIRIYSSDLTDGPVSYFNAWGAYYTRAWTVISAVHSGTGDGFQIVHPSGESFMLGINSDVGGPAVQIKGNNILNSHVFGILDPSGNHTFRINPDGKLLWGSNALPNLEDTDLYRDIAGRLKTSGSIGFATDVGNADRLAGMAGDYITSVALGSGLQIASDIISVDESVTNDHDWYNSSGLKPDDNTQDIYHEGDVHIGTTNTAIGLVRLNVYGNAWVSQSTSVNNLFINGGNLTATGVDNVALQQTAGFSLTTGSANILIGKEAGRLITIGQRNVGLGGAALYSLTTGGDNLAIGTAALAAIGTTSENTAVGVRALNANVGSQNTAIGLQAGFSNLGNEGVFIGFNAGNGSSGNKNTLIGAYAGNLATGSSIHLGFAAGYNSTTSDKLYIHNTNGANEADDKVISIIYGEMNTTTANQNLHLNANTRVTYNLTLPGIPTYADEAAATVGGLAQHSVYKTATGELRIKL